MRDKADLYHICSMENNIDDKELLGKVSSGSEEAFDYIYLRYSPVVTSYAEALLKDRHTADDICHNIFARLWEKRSSLSGIRSLKAYLFTATKNAVSPYVSISSAASVGDLAGLGAEPLFQISTSRYYDGAAGSTALSSAIRERGFCVFSNLLDYDAEVQKGKTDALVKFVEARIDFLQTDYGDSPHVQNFLQSRGLRQ